MNRKERRKLLRDGVNPKTVMDKYRDDTLEQGFQAGIRHSCIAIMTITAYNLHTHLGLGRKRLPEIMNWINESIDAFNTRAFATR